MGKAGCFYLAMVLAPAALPGQPANDDFAAAERLAGSAGRAAGTNVDATREPGEPLIVDEPGGSSVWWEWTAPRTEAVNMHTFASDFDTLLGVYTGERVSALEVVAENDDDDFHDGQSLVVFQAIAGTAYHIAVDGFDGETGNIVLQWSAGRPADDDFADGKVLEGPSGRVNAANFGATTEPGEPLIDGSAGGHSLWWRWTAPRTEQVTVHTFGSEFDTLLGVYTGNALSALELIGENDDAGDGFQSLVDFQAVAGTLYHFAVDGLDGETGNIVLGWISGSPANDDFADGEPVEGPSGRVEAANFGATSEAGEPPIDGELGGHSVWWRWTAARDGDVTIHTYGTAFDTLLGVYTGEALGALQLVAENDDAEDQPGGCPRPPCNPCPRPPCRGRGILPLVTGLESRVDFAAVAGTVYHIKVDGLDEETGHILLTWFQHSGAPLANDHFADRSRIEGTEGLVLASNDGATRENGEPDHADSGGVLSLWWSWVAPGDGTLELNTLGSTFDTVLAVYTGNALDALDLAGVNDDAGGPNDDLTSRVSLGVATGTEYQIAVDSLDESGLVALSWSFSPEQAPALRFLRGDCDGNGDATGQVTDAVVLLSYNFLAGSEPACLAACDADGDGRVTGAVTDAIYLLNFNFRAGPPPVAPFPTCGAGTRESDAVLGCDRPPSICD